MENNIISVIIPAYNASAVIRRCLGSLISQTFQDWEAIVVNDCSTDDTLSVVNDIIIKDERIQLVSLAENQGVAHARNTGLAEASGEYVFFMDSDDEIYPEALSNLLKSADSSLDMIVGCHNVTCNGPSKHHPMSVANDMAFHGAEVFPAFAAGNWHVMPWNKLIRRSFLLDNGLYFPEDLRFHEDYVWNIILASKAKGVKVIPKQTYNYIVNPDSITSQLTIERDLSGYLNAFEKIADFFKSAGMAEDPNAYSLLEGKKSCVMFSLMQHNEYPLFKRYYGEFRKSCLLSPAQARRLNIITYSYYIRDAHYLLPTAAGRVYKECFFWLYYKARGRIIEGAIWK